MDLDRRYVILQGIEFGNKFFTLNVPNVTQLEDGSTAFEILGYADTVEDAQIYLYGRSYTEGK